MCDVLVDEMDFDIRRNVRQQIYRAMLHYETLVYTRLYDSHIEMGKGIGLLADEMVQSVDRVGIDQAVACLPSSFDTVGTISVSRLNEYAEAHLSDTSAMPSKADSTPSSPISTPEVSAVLYASR